MGIIAALLPGLLAKESTEKNPNHTGEEPYNYFLSYMIAESNLKLYEFNRLVRDLNGLEQKRIFDAAGRMV